MRKVKIKKISIEASFSQLKKSENSLNALLGLRNLIILLYKEYGEEIGEIIIVDNRDETMKLKDFKKFIEGKQNE